MAPSLVVVRGSYRGLDPAYACVARDTRPGHYATFEVDGGVVQNRAHYRASERDDLQRLMRSYDTVYVDRRDGDGLLPLTPPPEALTADLNVIRRAKSEEEMRVMREMSSLTRRMLDGSPDDATFRGATSESALPYKWAFQKTDRPGFTEYRGGFQSASGLYTDLTRVEPKTAAFRGLLERTNRGLDAVQRNLREGASVEALTTLFRSHLLPTDRLYGGVLHHAGWEPEEPIPLQTVEKYDTLRLGATVGMEGTDAMRVYRDTLSPAKSPVNPTQNILQTLGSIGEDLVRGRRSAAAAPAAAAPAAAAPAAVEKAGAAAKAAAAPAAADPAAAAKAAAAPAAAEEAGAAAEAKKTSSRRSPPLRNTPATEATARASQAREVQKQMELAAATAEAEAEAEAEALRDGLNTKTINGAVRNVINTDAVKRFGVDVSTLLTGDDLHEAIVASIQAVGDVENVGDLNNDDYTLFIKHLAFLGAVRYAYDNYVDEGDCTEVRDELEKCLAMREDAEQELQLRMDQVNTLGDIATKTAVYPNLKYVDHSEIEEGTTRWA